MPTGFQGGLPAVGNDDSSSVPTSFISIQKNYEGFVKSFATIPQENLCRSQAHRRGGNPETWYSMLSSGEVRTIRERIDLDFAHSNKELLTGRRGQGQALDQERDPGQGFEINAFNYYLGQGKEIDTAMNWTACPQPGANLTRGISMRRVSRTFAFPELKRRGVLASSS